MCKHQHSISIISLYTHTVLLQSVTKRSNTHEWWQVWDVVITPYVRITKLFARGLFRGDCQPPWASFWPAWYCIPAKRLTRCCNSKTELEVPSFMAVAFEDARSSWDFQSCWLPLLYSNYTPQRTAQTLLQAVRSRLGPAVCKGEMQIFHRWPLQDTDLQTNTQ